VVQYELAESRARFPLDSDLYFDTLFWRHWNGIKEALLTFRPDLIQVTGPGHIGILGVIAARKLRIPLVASWHTNIHEFASRRLAVCLRSGPARLRQACCEAAETRSLGLTLRYYGLASLLLAPNPELTALLEERTGKPTHLMSRGVDASVFSPSRRRRDGSREMLLGYVGRLTPEKGVRKLVAIEKELLRQGARNYRFLVVGEGGEREWLAQNLRRASLPGILRGAALSDAYASMDVFLFPSETDTFGNVVLEALASGVPVIAAAGGGPKFLVHPGETGYLSNDAEETAAFIVHLLSHPAQHERMRHAAREAALKHSWDAVFERLYAAYEWFLSNSESGPDGPSWLPAASVPDREVVEVATRS
jgi:phosphatidylinositol alpha 1,6-mannosyltransferase